jgi:photosystem II stability/assembly factor-like uncharacterized protein
MAKNRRALFQGLGRIGILNLQEFKNRNDMKHTPKLWLFAFLLFTFQCGYGQWDSINLSPTKLLETVDFLTDDLGYGRVVMSQTGESILEKTTDGGITWTVITAPVSGLEFQAFDFSANGIGVAVFRDLQNTVTPTLIYQTSNDGATWQDISPDTTASGIGNAVCQFLDLNSGFLSTGESFYSTTNGGATWTTQTLGRYATAIDFIDANHGTLGFFDGTFGYLGSMMTTTDGGATWNTALLTQNGSVIGEVGQLTTTTSYAAPVDWGSYNQLKYFTTSNNGVSWDTVFVPSSVPNSSLSAIHFKDVSNGMIAVTAVGGISYFYETADGGTTWTFQDSLPGLNIRDLQLTDNTGYLAGGDYGKFYKLASALSVEEGAVGLLNIYPNPVASGARIQWNAAEQFDQLTLLDLSGKIVHQAAVQRNVAELPPFPAGMYLLRLEGDQKSVATRLMMK